MSESLDFCYIKCIIGQESKRGGRNRERRDRRKERSIKGSWSEIEEQWLWGRWQKGLGASSQSAGEKKFRVKPVDSTLMTSSAFNGPAKVVSLVGSFWLEFHYPHPWGWLHLSSPSPHGLKQVEETQWRTEEYPLCSSDSKGGLGGEVVDMAEPDLSISILGATVPALWLFFTSVPAGLSFSGPQDWLKSFFWCWWYTE